MLTDVLLTIAKRCSTSVGTYFYR
ncbi:rCG52659 [Rattus norvegicus]|uniref:RCG52659 n=1 Tax=Rattus norvegicus TaxID=10116 RepID=A6IRT0_RAT|nr:rCG52659 [Rattus norvegicus]